MKVKIIKTRNYFETLSLSHNNKDKTQTQQQLSTYANLFYASKLQPSKKLW